MKSIFASSALAAVALIFSAQVFADNSPIVVPTTFDKAYVPDGFDDNDNVQIQTEGIFRNSCFRYAKASVAIDHEKKTIKLTPLAYEYRGICLMVVLPFDRTLDLGILQHGVYTVTSEPEGKTLGTIGVGHALTASPDSYLYAPITQAFFKASSAGHKVYLTGNFPLSCMRLTEVKTHVQPDVFVVQPVVEIDKTVPCVDGQFPFEASTDASMLKKGRYLLHVRSMNGKAINTLIDVP